MSNQKVSVEGASEGVTDKNSGKVGTTPLADVEEHQNSVQDAGLGHSQIVIPKDIQLDADRPNIICLCGSTRFIEMFAIKTWELEREGNIVLGCTLLPMWYCNVQSHFGEATGTKEQCDELHKRKIDLADEVLVLDIGGYIGESTRNEIEYATATGKPIRYLSETQDTKSALRGDNNNLAVAGSVQHDPEPLAIANGSSSSEISLTLAEIRKPKRRQLVHTARQMFETRWAKYNDPHNEEWDFDNITDKWERHAWSAYLDLVEVEKERDSLLSIIDSLQAEVVLANKRLDDALVRAVEDQDEHSEQRAKLAKDNVSLCSQVSQLEQERDGIKAALLLRVRERAAEIEAAYDARDGIDTIPVGAAAQLKRLAAELEAIDPSTTLPDVREHDDEDQNPG